MDELLKILLIEDDEVDRIAVGRGLKAAGLTVNLQTETTASEGLERLGKESFDCIFLDYLLPGMDGLALLKEIRSIGVETPIVVITSKGDEKIAVEMMKAGASDYVPKSLITGEGLAQSLRSALRNAQLTRDKQKAEKALREKEQQLQTVIRNAPLILFIMDRNGTILLSEGAGLQTASFETDSLVGKTAFEVFRDNEFALELIKRALGGEQFIRQLRIGNTYFDTHFSPVFDLNGNVEQVLGVCMDITNHIVAERKLKKAKILAEKNAKAKEEFLANMSHEIRTPMNAIMGFARLLAKTPLTEEQHDYLNNISRSGDTLLVIINDILDLSKIEAGKLNFEDHPFQLRDLLDAVFDMLRPRADEKGLELLQEIRQEVPKVIRGDAVRLNQVLINLIGNAIKFTPSGSVKLRISPEFRTQDSVILKFNVVDTGIGIPEDKQRFIFRSFSQASASTTRQFGGTGLGLTICKRLIELQGGAIGVESEVGKGSDFWFELGFKLGNSAEIATLPNPISLNRKAAHLHLLLVEDNLMNQRLATKVLEDFGFQLSLAENGQEALDKLKAENFDLVLMDVQMPVMDGYEATRIIRGEFPAPLKDIPILGLTAHAIPEEIRKCKAAGMNDVATKPFLPEELFDKIMGMIGQGTAAPPSTPQTEKSLIDLSYLLDLAGGDRDFMVEMIDIFLNQVPKSVENLQEAITAEAWEQVYQLAHALKPSFLTFGLTEGGELTKKLEEVGKAGGPPANAESLIQELEALTNQATEELGEVARSQ